MSKLTALDKIKLEIEQAQNQRSDEPTDTYNKKNVMTDEQISAFDEEGEPLQDIAKKAMRNAKTQVSLHQTWDYKGYKTLTNVGYCQKDWNQTMMTKINQISGQIHRTTLKGGGNTIEINPRLKSLFDSMEYCHTNEETGEMNFLGRYKILLNEEIGENTIKVKFVDPKPISQDGEVYLIPNQIKEPKDGMMGEVSFTLKSRKHDSEEIDAYLAKIEGTVRIQNYTDADVKIENEQAEIRKNEVDYPTAKEVAAEIAYERRVDKDLMNRNYQNGNVDTIKTSYEGMSNEDVLSAYQTQCDMPMGLLFYFVEASDKKITVGETGLMMQSTAVMLRDTEATLERMNEISSQYNFKMWAGGHKHNIDNTAKIEEARRQREEEAKRMPQNSNTMSASTSTFLFTNTTPNSHRDSILPQVIREAMKQEERDFKELLGMGGEDKSLDSDFLNSALKNGEPKRDWTKLKKLKTTWSPELAQDITSHSGSKDAEIELVSLLKEYLSKELTQEETDVINKVENGSELLEAMDSLGYILGPTLYDPMNFTPMKSWYKEM